MIFSSWPDDRTHWLCESQWSKLTQNQQRLSTECYAHVVYWRCHSMPVPSERWDGDNLQKNPLFHHFFFWIKLKIDEDSRQGFVIWQHCTRDHVKRVTLVYLYHVNRCGHHKKLSIAKLDFAQVCGLSLNFYNNTLRKFHKFSDSPETWTSPTLQSADWPISRQYYWPQVRQRVSYPEV